VFDNDQKAKLVIKTVWDLYGNCMIWLD